jgi:hypothetical protein
VPVVIAMARCTNCESNDRRRSESSARIGLFAQAQNVKAGRRILWLTGIRAAMPAGWPTGLPQVLQN